MTHARRMVMSLAIYVVLLFLFVWLPTALFKAAMPTALPVHLRLFYVIPQLQVFSLKLCWEWAIGFVS